MKIDVYLRNKETGETGIFRDEYDWLDEPDYPATDAIAYMYGEGNYSCDCNRVLFLYGWDVDDEGVECGDDRIAIDKILNRETGELIYKDDTD